MLEQAREVTTAFQVHYNTERPNQARSCGNRPPRVAFPELPPSPLLPMLVDPDAWLPLIDGRRYVRQVQVHGSVLVEHVRDDVGRRLAGQRVVLAVVADDFALGPAVRRWLDDDEYRVRRRIHADTRALVGPGS